MDIAFGTFKASFNEHPQDKHGPKPREDAKSTLLLLPTQEFITYLAGSFLCMVPWAYYSIQRYDISSQNALLVSSLVGGGPIVLSSIVTRVYSTSDSSHPVKMSVLENLFHLFFGILFCGVPITYACYLTLT